MNLFQILTVSARTTGISSRGVESHAGARIRAACCCRSWSCCRSWPGGKERHLDERGHRAGELVRACRKSLIDETTSGHKFGKFVTFFINTQKHVSRNSSSGNSVHAGREQEESGRIDPPQTKSMSDHDPTQYRTEVLASLTTTHGHLISVRVLHQVLGFRSYAALKQAAANGTLTIPLIYIAGRRARHAMAVDVADWLTDRWLETRQAKSPASSGPSRGRRAPATTPQQSALTQPGEEGAAKRNPLAPLARGGSGVSGA